MNMDPLSIFVGYNLKRAMAVVQADLVRVLARHNLKLGTFTVLAAIGDAPGIAAIRLAELLGIERSNLVAILDDLGRRGLITRSASLTDRRSHELHRTAEGTAVFQAALADVHDHEAKVFAGLTTEERAEMIRLCQKLWAT